MRPTITTEQFITAARSEHGEVYGYDNVIYTRANNKVQITCKIHGEFNQRASNHLTGSGCPDCSNIKHPTIKLTTKQFILKATKTHNNLYSYGRTNYTIGKGRVIITCKTHGDFSQSASNHLAGAGCKACAVDARRSKQP